MAKNILDEASKLLEEMKISREALSDYEGMGLPDLSEEQEHSTSIYLPEPDHQLSTEELEAEWISAERMLGRMQSQVRQAAFDAGGMIAMMNASHQISIEGGAAPVRRMLRFLAEDGERSAMHEELWQAVDMARGQGRVLKNPDPSGHLDHIGIENTARAIGLRTLLGDDISADALEEMIVTRTAPLPIDKAALSEFREQVELSHGGVGLKAAGRKIASVMRFIISNHLIDEERLAIQGGNVIRFNTPGGSGLILSRTLAALLPAIVGECTLGEPVPLLGTANILSAAERTADIDLNKKSGWAEVDRRMIPVLARAVSDADFFAQGIRSMSGDWIRKTRELPPNIQALGAPTIRTGYITARSAQEVANKTDRWARGAIAQLISSEAIRPLVARTRYRIYIPTGLPALIEKYGMW